MVKPGVGEVPPTSSGKVAMDRKDLVNASSCLWSSQLPCVMSPTCWWPVPGSVNRSGCDARCETRQEQPPHSGTLPRCLPQVEPDLEEKTALSRAAQLFHRSQY